jgi:hypothetical protein
MLSNQDIKFCQKLKDRGQMKIGERQALEKRKKTSGSILGDSLR